jgi:2-iminobutanoate/2-iminopropanoate deaminase
MKDRAASSPVPDRVQPAGMALPGGHYSHAVRVGDFVFVSGQLPIDVDGNKLADASFEVQARQVLRNVDLALAASGTDSQRLVQVRGYVTSIADWPLFDAVYAQWLGSHRPARAVVPVPELHHGLRIELEAVAVA